MTKNSTNTPCILSIIIPVYNGSNYLSKAINSILEQKNDFPSLEIIVVNDGSKDDFATKNVAESFGDQIRYYEKKNGGVSTALNFGIEKMNGNYFSWLSHDDYFLPGRFAAIRDRIGDLGQYQILAHDYRLVDENEQKIRDVVDLRSAFQSHPYYNLKGCYLCGCALIIPKGLFEKIGKFRVDLKFTQDLEMWSRLGKFAELIYVPLVLTSMRVHIAQVTMVQSEKMIAEDSILQVEIIAKYLLNEEDWNTAAKKLGFKYTFLMLIYMVQYSKIVRRSAGASQSYLNSYQGIYGRTFVSKIAEWKVSLLLFSIGFYSKRFLIFLNSEGLKSVPKIILLFLRNRRILN